MVSCFRMGGFAGFREDDRLRRRGPADLLDPPGGGDRELVDVGPGAGPRALAGDGGHRLRVLEGRHPGHGVHHGDDGLPAATDEVDVALLARPRSAPRAPRTAPPRPG